MENFGNIKDTFKDIVIESVLKKENGGKKLFSKFVKSKTANPYPPANIVFLS